MEIGNNVIEASKLAGAIACGPNLEYDPAFVELERSVLGKPEVQYGDTISPAVPPDWKAVRQQALDLLGRSSDLRVAVPLARALLALEGMPGFARGLHTIAALLADHWPDVHPQLERDDGDDPTLRINCIAALGDSTTVLRELNDAVLIVLPGLGPLTLRQLDQASGDAPLPAGQVALAPASIEAALGDVPPDTVREALAAATRACESAANIESTLAQRVGSAQGIDLQPLLRLLGRIREWLRRHVPESAAETPLQVAPAGAGSVQVAAPRPGGEIVGRDDVVEALDRVLAYYARQEPSSPVPMLIERARWLVPKTFMEIIEDLAPDSVGQLRVIRGTQQG